MSRQPIVSSTAGGVHYGAGPDKGSTVSLLRLSPSSKAASSVEYAYVLGPVDRFSSPLLEPLRGRCGRCSLRHVQRPVTAHALVAS